MCGRYYRKSNKQKIAEAFHASRVDDLVLPPWDNIVPTSMQPIIRANRDTGDRELVSLRCGAWCRSWPPPSQPSKASPRSTPAPRRSRSRAPIASPSKSSAALVPASGFYEWKRIGDPMSPKKGPGQSPLRLRFHQRWVDGLRGPVGQMEGSRERPVAVCAWGNADKVSAGGTPSGPGLVAIASAIKNSELVDHIYSKEELIASRPVVIPARVPRVIEAQLRS